MQIVTVSAGQGDLLRTEAQALGISLNARGRLEVTPFYTALADRFPVFASEYRRRGRGDLLAPGDVWIWREGTPWIVGLVTRETPHGPARLRSVELALLNLSKIWRQEGLRSLALMPLGDAPDGPAVRDLLERAFGQSDLHLTLYEV